ncbi:MAG: DUF4279 domain-containing protein [Myxococcales bacterium]|nr:DUF4279 domain-containing protein [Myxococcales bacterium]
MTAQGTALADDMKSEVRVSIVLAEFVCDPGAIEGVLGVRPSKTWRAGDRIGKSSRTYRVNGWALQSELPKDRALQEHVDWLLARMPRSLQALKVVSPSWTAEVSCVVYVVEQVPELHLNAKTIGRIAELGAEIDIDLYCLGEDGDGG